MSERLVEVAPAVPLKYTQRQTYTYRLPSSPDSVLYRMVDIPFARRRVRGVILAENVPPVPYKTQTAVLASYPPLTEQQIAFAKWISRTMQGGLGFTLRLFMPSGRMAEEAVPARSPISIQEHTEQALIVGDDKKRIPELLKQPQPLLIIVPELYIAERLVTKKAVFVHGGLSPKQFSDIWQGVYHGRYPIIIGTQKALFLPFQSLKTIILEEESFSTHTLWDQYPRLSNVYGAQKLASLFSANVLYSGSFPSVRLSHALAEKKMPVLKNKPTIPKVNLLALTFSDRRQRHILPPKVITDLRAALKKKEKIAVLYNRRPSDEKMEDIFKKVLPRKHKIIRINASVAAEYSPAEVNTALDTGALVLGTSAFFPYLPEAGLDRVIWLFPEIGMLFPDFRSRERAMITLSRLQKLIPKKRSVTIVTKSPTLIQERLAISLPEYIKQELAERARLHFPPFTDMVRLNIVARTKKTARTRAIALRQEIMTRHIDTAESLTLRGPFESVDPPPLGKAESHLLLLGRLSYLKKLYDGLVLDSIDLDPQQIL